MKTLSNHAHFSGRSSGFALVVVLLVLLALLVLTTPFLTSARNADQASQQLSERSSARIGLNSAAKHARLSLSDTYPSADMDTTPYFDGLDEIHVDNAFDPAFLDANDPRGPMWDVELRDISGMIDLNSASPLVIANMLGLAMRFSEVISPESKTLPLSSSAGLEDTGFVWSEGELVHYTKKDGSTLTQFVRGMFGPGAKTEWRGGPRPSSAHGAGAPVVDQRAFAPCLWRLGGGDGELRTFEALEELPQCGVYARALQLLADKDGTELPEELVRPLIQDGTVHAGPRGGPVWQRAARVTTPIEGKKDGKLYVDNARWINVGATVRIRDGQTTELALVQNVIGNGEIALDRILQNDYEAYAAVLDVLARRPVNLNTATRDVLRILFSNLQVRGHNSRITADEAGQLADLVIESRPLTGFEDFLRRVVLPAAGIERLPSDAPVVPDILKANEGFLDPLDAAALYVNGLNANDGSLQYGTMPYSFTTRDTYATELRSTVNAESGVERFALVRDEVVVVAPQKELVRLWARQEDFDEELRLTCDAPWWATGPSATTRYDSGAQPPSRTWAHMGTFEDQLFMPGVTDTSQFKDRESPPTAEHVFASRENQGWIQLATTREEDESVRRKGRVLHFDNESRDLEGRYLPDQIVRRATDDLTVRWTAPNVALMRSIGLSMWIRPRSVGDAKYLDVAGVSSEVDRVSLAIEGADLVLRVVDGFGDHRETPERDVGEVRYGLSGTNTPGLPADIWSHVEIDVRGNRPSQMNMLVNGLAHGVRTPGLTRLSGALSQGSATIAVESTEGFPTNCVLRIGNELIEVTKSGQNTFDASRLETGKLAGFGGRTARERMNTLSDEEPMVPIGLTSVTTDHPAGTPVELYGYSLPVASNVPVGRSQMAGELGPFRVGIVRGVIAGQGGALGEPITYGLLGFTAGYGMKGATNSTVSGLILASADDGLDVSTPTPPEEYMKAFNRDGGYAAVVQFRAYYQGAPALDTDGMPIGGVEIIRYSGWQGTTLQIAARGVATLNLPVNAAGGQSVVGGRRSFVVNWSGDLIPMFGNRIDKHVFVVPISLAVPGVSDLGFLPALAGNSQFAQITHIDDAENTEWVRYDFLDSSLGQLVRDDPNALQNVYEVLIHSRTIPDFPSGPPPPPPPGGGGPPGGQAVAKSKAAVEPAPSAPQTYTSTWNPRIGQNENKPRTNPAEAGTWPVSRAVEVNFQFRGVSGTYSHKHPNGTTILPVFRMPAKEFDSGRPGRLDAIFLAGASPDHPGWPLRVHRAYVQSPEIADSAWKQQIGNDPNPRPITSSAAEVEVGSAPPPPVLGPAEAYLQNFCWVALQDKSPEPMTPGVATPGTNVQVLDTRLITRMVCFPSGERPRLVSTMAIGGGVNGAPGAIPPAIVDEIVIGGAEFGRAAPVASAEDTDGASLVLVASADDGALTLTVGPKEIRTSLGELNFDHLFLGDLPQDGGLLKIGEEILAYKSLSMDTGQINVATNGRGLLGTRAQPHQFAEPVMFLDQHVVTTLSGPQAAGDARLAVTNIEDFAREGTVLIGDELISYTRLRENALEMPRASAVPGAMDQKGDGLFRGRYGTQPAAHAASEAVIAFPVRYPDRWERRADAPELAYFGFSIDQPAAFFGSCFFSKVDTDSARIGVLQRTDVTAPWDADPDSDKRLALWWQGENEATALPIDKQSDHVDWRVFVDYQPGAFDARTGMQHGWKQTPRLKLFSVFYHAPSLVLRSVER